MIALAIVTLAVYARVYQFEFIDFDDNTYVYENESVRKGLTIKNLIWAFDPGRESQAYWHPLTWLSHMADIELFGLDPAGHHLMNLAFHIANILLLFLVLRLMTGAVWQSAFAAALFALHPINVDSVVWIAERKNLISTAFWMLTMLAYIRYARKPGLAGYLLVLSSMALGLMAKPMLMTLPCVLLLLDYWPLGRIRLTQTHHLNTAQPLSQPDFQKAGIRRLIIEKIPLLLLALLVVFIFAFSLSSNHQFIDLQSVPLSLRIENAIVSYAAYLWKLIWPANLTVFYPYPQTIPLWKTLAAALLLLGISIPIAFTVKKFPYLAVGWFWYLGTLVPAIGLIQGGLMPALADRWAYIPAIGIFIMIAWGLPELGKRIGLNPKRLLIPAIAALCVLGMVSWKQTGHWRNNQTLFQHALEVTADNYVAHNNLGKYHAEMKQTAEALRHYQNAIEIKPDSAETHYNMGNALFDTNRLHEAVNAYQNAIRIRPGYAQAHYNLGNTYKKLSHLEESISHYRQTVAMEPDHAKAHYNLAMLLADRKQVGEALYHYQKAIGSKPDFRDAHLNLAMLLSRIGRQEEALEHYQKALAINPKDADAHYNCANAFNAVGKADQAILHFRKAIAIDPGHAKAHNNLATTLLNRGRAAEAIPHYAKAVEINPEYASAHYNLGIAYFQTGNQSGAAASFREALRLNPGAKHIQAALDQAMKMP